MYINLSAIVLSLKIPVFMPIQEDEIFQYTVTAALLAMYLAKRTKFLFPNRGPLSEEEIDDDLGKVVYCSFTQCAYSSK